MFPFDFRITPMPMQLIIGAFLLPYGGLVPVHAQDNVQREERRVRITNVPPAAGAATGMCAGSRRS